MKSCEKNISSESDYYIYFPSIIAKTTFFYPLRTGHFFYEPGYRQYRSSFDSFLLMYIPSGELSVEFERNGEICTSPAFSDSFILLDCYRPHGYHTSHGYECFWVHFDGPVARAWYDLVVSHLGNIFTLPNSNSASSKIKRIFHIFHNNETIREAYLSKLLSDILTACLLSPLNESQTVIDEVITYINEHFAEGLTNNILADYAMMSPYHFIRVFKKETGYTPHEYITNTRISIAKYMLKTTSNSVKDICFYTGFSCESVFCTAFKKHVGITPAEYRKTPN